MLVTPATGGGITGLRTSWVWQSESGRSGTSAAWSFSATWWRAGGFLSRSKGPVVVESTDGHAYRKV